MVGLAALLLPLAPSWAQRDRPATPEAGQDQPDPTADAVLKDSLKEELGRLEKKIAEKWAELKALVDSGHAIPKSAADGQYTAATNALLETEMEMLEAQADLEAAEKHAAKAREKGRSPESQERLEARIAEEFQKNDPDAAALIAKIKEAHKELESVKQKARVANDPARLVGEKHMRKLKQQWESLWNERHDQLARKLTSDDPGDSLEMWEEKIADLKLTLEKLRKKKLSLAKRIEN